MIEDQYVSDSYIFGRSGIHAEYHIRNVVAVLTDLYIVKPCHMSENTIASTDSKQSLSRKTWVRLVLKEVGFGTLLVPEGFFTRSRLETMKDTDSK